MEVSPLLPLEGSYYKEPLYKFSNDYIEREIKLLEIKDNNFCKISIPNKKEKILKIKDVIKEMIQNNNENLFENIKQLCISPGGLLNIEYRKIFYKYLLGIRDSHYSNNYLNIYINKEDNKDNNNNLNLLSEKIYQGKQNNKYINI